MHLTKNIMGAVAFALVVSLPAFAQTTYDSSTLVDTNSNTTSTSTVNSTNTNTNNNVNTTTVESTSTNNNNNNNVNSSTSTNTNTNYNVQSGSITNTNNNTNTSTATTTNNNNNTSTSSNTNANTNVNTSTATSTSNNNNVNTGYQQNDIKQRVISPPPTAIAPSMMSGGNSDLCTTGISGAMQTQILGLSGGSTVRDLNCERLKLSKTLYDMGMKVAAVATMCQDRRVWDAMMSAGTPCPVDGKIGEAARQVWAAEPKRIPQPVIEPKEGMNNEAKAFGLGAAIAALLAIIF